MVKRPAHKPINRREDFSPDDKKMAAPLGMEDKNSFVNLPLICTLRGGNSNKTLKTINSKRGLERTNSGDQSSIQINLPNEPSFYHSDV